MNTHIDDLECIKTKLNQYIESTNFQDDELVKLSISIDQYIQDIIYDSMNPDDKRAYNIRHLLAHISTKLDYILTQI